MFKISEELKKYNLTPHKYTNKGNVTIVKTDNGDFVFKKTHNNIFEYLNSRSFNYYPDIISDTKDDYMITRYLDSIDMPLEQKIDDMIDLVSLLHSKTTHFKQVDSLEYSNIYDDIKNNIEYLYGYYNDIMGVIENKIFFSPAEYSFSLNVSKIYEVLDICLHRLDDWYSKVKDKNKKRLVVLHNNLCLDHFIKNEKAYLISWDKAKIDMPIFDLYKLFKNNYDKFNMEEVLKRYEKNYPLEDEERNLLFILLLLPDKFEFEKSNINSCIKISKMFMFLDRVKDLLPNNFEYAKNN